MVLTAFLTAFLAPAAPSPATAEAPSPAIDQLASAHLLAHNFSRVAFELEWTSRPLPRVAKWTGPIRVALIGADGAAYRGFVDEHLARLTRLTGLDISRVEAGDRRGNLRVYFVPRARMAETAAAHSVDAELFRRAVGSAPCMYAYFGDTRHRIVRGVAILAADTAPTMVRACVVEELTQLLGLPMDTELIRPSVFSNFDLAEALTVNDQILVRALYDRRIAAGMERRRAEAVARRVIAELWTKVRRSGVDALHQ